MNKPPRKKIVSVEQLRQLARCKRAVVCESGWSRRPMPAVFVMNMQAEMVCRLIDHGLYIYERSKT